MRDDQVSCTAESADLLHWYDRHARDLPWRVGPAARKAGTTPDPYRIWLSEIMLQQTTVAAVASYFHRFTQLWPRVTDLAAAEDAQVMAEWAGLGYYARARNLLKCARAVVDNYGGTFPATRDALIALPGIGPYTAAAIASIAFDQPETVVDGNVERVMARLHGVETPLPAAKAELTKLAASLTPSRRPGDYAQAVMDLGATICTPRNPACGICPWQASCVGRRTGVHVELPRKSPKKAKPVRFGHAYVAQSTNGAVLLETRPPSGLLGGMQGWPGTTWQEEVPDPVPPVAANWQRVEGEVRHTFTHFHLRLTIWTATLPDSSALSGLEWTPRTMFRPTDLPTVMRKAWNLASPAFPPL